MAPLPQRIMSVPPKAFSNVIFSTPVAAGPVSSRTAGRGAGFSTGDLTPGFGLGAGMAGVTAAAAFATLATATGTGVGTGGRVGAGAGALAGVAAGWIGLTWVAGVPSGATGAAAKPGVGEAEGRARDRGRPGRGRTAGATWARFSPSSPPRPARPSSASRNR